MSNINEMVEIPDEMLESVVGGVLGEPEKAKIREITEGLKRIDISYKNAIEWWQEQTAGNRFSEKEWKEIEDIVKSVYAEE